MVFKMEHHGPVLHKVRSKVGVDLNKATYLLLHFIEQTRYLPGDIAEFGIYRGATLASVALYLKERRIDKTIYAFDSFKGFPQFHPCDSPDQFDRLLEQGKITEDHYQKAKGRLAKINELGHLSPNKFSDVSKDMVIKLLKDIEVFDVVKIKIFEGFFADTLHNLTTQLCLAFLDCDLYESYLTCLAIIYPLMVEGGIILLDEYYSLKYPGPRVAVDEFFSGKPEKPRRIDLIPGDTFERWYIQF